MICRAPLIGHIRYFQFVIPMMLYHIINRLNRTLNSLAVTHQVYCLIFPTSQKLKKLVCLFYKLIHPSKCIHEILDLANLFELTTEIKKVLRMVSRYIVINEDNTKRWAGVG